LPARKQVAITDRQRIDPNAEPGAKTKDQTVRAAADFDHPRVSADRSELLERFAHTLRGSLHRGDYLVLATAEVLSFLSLVL
jgi:hypothetical protein